MVRTIITILDGITETSMPFNEFVLYRANHYSDEKQVLIVCGSKKNLPKVNLPDNLVIKYAGRKLINIRKTIKSTIYEIKKRNEPYVIHIHQVQSGFLSEMAMLGTGFRKKTLFTVHSTFSGYKFHNKFLSFVNALFAFRITCVSNTSFQDYPKLIKRIKGNRILAIQNGVDIERIDEVSSVENIDAHNYVNFIYVARLIPLKNHRFLVDVLSHCNDSVHFTFVGAEDPEQTIRKLAKELDVEDRITFTGLIPRNEVFEKLKGSDFYISASTLEGLPVSVLEAMYCGLPCILSDIPQHREVAGDQAVILPFDIEKWVSELNKLSTMLSEDKRVLSNSIKNYVTENFSLKSMHIRYDSIYEQL